MCNGANAETPAIARLTSGDHHGTLEMWAAMDYRCPKASMSPGEAIIWALPPYDLLNRSRTICSREVTLSSFFCTTAYVSD